MARLLLGPVVAALVIMAGAASPAMAKSLPLTGQVVGAPYASGTRTVVPVVLSSGSARRAHLRSPLGMLAVSRGLPVAVPSSAAVRPGSLRVGDALRLTANVGRSARRAIYPRLPVSNLRITRRSTQPSTAELQAILADHARQLAALAAQLNALTDFTRRGFADVDARLAALRADVDALQAGLRSVQSTLDGLSGSLTTTRDTLLTKIDLVRSDLQPQVTAVASQLTDLVSTIGSCGPPASGVAGDVCGLQAQVSALTPVNLTALTSRVDQISSALTTTVDKLTGLTLTGDLPANLTPGAITALTSLYDLQGTVGGLSSQVGTLGGKVTTLEGLVGGVNVPALSATVSGLGGQVSGIGTQVTNLITTLGTDPTGLNSSVLSGLQTQLTTLQGSLSGLSSTVTGQGTQLSTLQGTVNTLTGTTIPALSSQLNTVCTTWRGLLSGQTLQVFNLLSALSGTTTLPALPGC